MALRWISLLLVFMIVPAYGQGIQPNPSQGTKAKKGALRNQFEDPPPIPDQGGGAADYNALRAIDCTPDVSEREITSGQFAGIFNCYDTDPYGNGDDSTVVIVDAGTDFWVRSFAHTRGDPLQMDWWERLADNVDATEWFTSHAGVAYEPFPGGQPTDVNDFHVQFPSTDASGVNTIRTYRIDFSAEGINEQISFLEADKAVTVEHHASDSELRELWQFTTYEDFVVGGPNKHITFLGKHPQLSTGENSGDPDHGDALFLVAKGSSNPSLFSFSANMTDSYARGLAHTGVQNFTASQKTDSVYIAGQFVNADVYLNGGADLVYMDSVYVSDPWGASLGWEGADSPCDGNSSNTITQDRHRAIDFVYNSRVRGAVILQYGAARTGWNFLEQMGTSETDRFTIISKDSGFIGLGTCAGTRVEGGVTFWPSGKIDAVRTNAHPTRPTQYLNLEFGPNTYGYGVLSFTAGPPVGGTIITRGWSNEASSANGGSCCFYTEFMNIMVEKADNQNFSWSGSATSEPQLGFVADNDPGCTGGPTVQDRIKDNFYTVPSGETGGKITVHENGEVTGDGTWRRVAVSAATTSGNSCLQTGSLNIHDTSVSTEVVFNSNTSGTVEGVTFTASSQAVMTIAAGVTVTVPSGAGNGLTSTGSGATITGSGTLNCNGGGVSLPYDFDTDSACEY